MGFVVLDEAGLLPGICVEVDATNDPTDPTRVWTDITPLVRQIQHRRSGRNQEIARSTAGSLSAICGDAGGAITGLGLGKRQWMRVRAMPPGNGVLLNLGPKLFWRLGDAPGASTAKDSSGNGNVGTYGAGVTLGQSGAIAGDPTLSALFNNTANGTVTSSYQPFVVGSQRTFMGWANRSSTADFDVLFGGANGSGATATLCYIGAGNETVVFGATEPTQVGWVSAWPGVSQWVHWAITYDDTAKVAELFTNGVSQGTRTLTAGYPANGAFLAGSYSTGGLPWNGYMQDVAVFETILTAAQIQTIYNANTIGIPRWQGILENLPRKWPGQGADQLVELKAADAFKVLGFIDLSGLTFPQQRNDQRVSAILALVPALSGGTIDTDTDTSDPVTTPFPDETMALDYLLQIEASEDGLLVASPDGTVTFQGRHWRFFNAATPAATFGENPAAGEIPYMDDVELDDGDSVLFNVAGVTPFNGSSAIVAVNSASTARNWPTRMDVQLLSSDINLATDASNWLAYRYGDPSPRIPAITAELAAVARLNPGLVATLLAAGNSTRFKFKRAASSPINEDVWVEQISETIDVAGGSWQWKAQLSPAFDRAMWVAEDPVFGLAEETTVGAY